MTDRKIFAASDHHFGHANILNFKGNDGNPIRPGFLNLDDMNEIIVRNHNNIVTPDDIVYFLGDFAFGGKSNIAKFATRLNGRKRLILGNHDYNAKDYVPFFDEIMSWRQFGNEYAVPLVLCHYPLHISAFGYRAGSETINVHGHIHEKVVEPFSSKPSQWVNVAMERCNYTPVDLADIANGKYRG